jgi:hypothetical protein
LRIRINIEYRTALIVVGDDRQTASSPWRQDIPGRAAFQTRCGGADFASCDDDANPAGPLIGASGLRQTLNSWIVI